MQKPCNIFADIPNQLADELIETLAENQHIRIERIVSTGHTTPVDTWYDQDQDEWVILLKGNALIQFDDQQQPVSLRPGDHLLIPAHRKHRVSWTSADPPAVWLAVFF